MNKIEKIIGWIQEKPIRVIVVSVSIPTIITLLIFNAWRVLI